VSLISARRRLRFVACLLLALTCLMAVGVVCACSSDQSLQTVQRLVQTASASAALPAVIGAWSVFTLTLTALFIRPMLTTEPDKRGRASPQTLQRFLF
jgi:hypothetical protein